ncbi:hypothetical protein TCAL_02059 [Tigriopus californicus]|uniref:Uncharacterized protein n=1 Tax=Tigriopus californicus TaxID=6832 RepID=A0A553NB55_TIGCA|nr:hypothetical protein TCAL_02059 [Tigriopus californicus]
MAQAFVDKHQAQIGLERSLIKSTITEILESSIQEHRLRSKTVDELDQLFEIYANELCSVLGQTIRSQCLAIGYRVVVQVVLTAFKDQGIDVSQKCAWHSALDNYIQVSAGGKNALILVQTYFSSSSNPARKQEALQDYNEICLDAKAKATVSSKYAKLLISDAGFQEAMKVTEVPLAQPLLDLLLSTFRTHDVLATDLTHEVNPRHLMHCIL